MSEPVEYQYRTRPDWIAEWNGWNTCSKESAEAYEKNPYLHDWHYEVRALYTSPPAQRTWVGLSDEEIAEMWLEILGSTPPSGIHEDGLQPWRFARAIEAKLKEKNNG